MISETKQNIIYTIDQEIIEKYSEEILNRINTFDEYYRNFLKFAVLRYDMDKDCLIIKHFLDELKKIKEEELMLNNYLELINDYLKPSTTEKKQFAEVMTDFTIIDEMLDLYEQNDFKNPELKWIGPSAGIGNFQVKIVERLMSGLKVWEPDREKRYKHIVENQIYISELQSKNVFLFMMLFDPNNKYKLNVFRGSFLSKEFDEHMKNVWKVEKFDRCAENPPYQEMDGGAKASARPIYNLFVEKSIKICEQTLMITPSRWFAGGKGLDKFRKMMMESNKIKLINHFDDASKIFGSGVEIKGGVSYFLYDNNYNGKTLFNNIEVELNQFDIVVNNISALSFAAKMMKYDNISSLIQPRSLFGISTDDKRLETIKKDNYIKCYVSKQKGFEKWININEIKDIQKTKHFRVVTPRAATKGGEGFGNIFISNPNECISDTYISIPTNAENEAKSIKSYLETKFANFLLSLRKISQTVKADTCKWIPIVPFNRIWTDEQLYEYFKLSQEEISLIEKNEK